MPNTKAIILYHVWRLCARMNFDLETLYRNNRGLLYKVARRYYTLCVRDRAIGLEDLMQEGALALARAAATFDAEAGCKWTTWAGWFIMKAMRRALGLFSHERAHVGAISLDAPLSDNPDVDATLLDTLEADSPHPTAELEDDEIYKAVHHALDLIPEKQRRAVNWVDLQGLTIREAAAREGCSEVAILNRREAARESLRLRLSKYSPLDGYVARAYHHVGVNKFKATWTSATEDAVLWKLDQEEKEDVKLWETEAI